MVWNIQERDGTEGAKGTGYLTACFALMVGPQGHVVGVEHIPELVTSSVENIKKSSAASLSKEGSLSIHVADGRLGWPELAPCDAIHVGAAAPEIPQPLIDQLKPGGRMVIPVGTVFQNLKVVDKKLDGSVSVRNEICVWIPLLTMSKDSYAKQNELGPNYLGYYKHLFFELFSQNEDIALPIPGSNSEPSVGDKGRKDKSCSASGSFFSRGIGEELSEFQKENLKSMIHESALCFNQEADEIFGQILSVFQTESDRSKKELLSGCASASDEDMNEPNCSRKRKASPSPISRSYLSYTDILNSQSVRQVYNDIQAVQGNDEICQEALEKANVISATLCKMEQDLEEFLDVVVSKCRAMTHAEKRQLGKQIQKLPDKAFDRVVDIVQQRNLSARHISDNIFINLEEQDNVTLWRLYYYVQTINKANKL